MIDFEYIQVTMFAMTASLVFVLASRLIKWVVRSLFMENV